MEKILFGCRRLVLGILVVVCVMATALPAAWAVTTTGNSSAVIITPIEVTFVNTLGFGGFALLDPSIPGSIEVPALGGSPTPTGVVVLNPTSTPGLATITGEAGVDYRLNSLTSETVILTRDLPGGTTPMTANVIYRSDTTAATAVVGGTAAQGGKLNGTGNDILRIGGVLLVPAFVEPGPYTGLITVDVDY